MNKLLYRKTIARKLNHEEYLKLITDYIALNQDGRTTLYTGAELAKKYKISRTTVYRYLNKAENELL